MGSEFRFFPVSVPIITQTVLFGYRFLLHFPCPDGESVGYSCSEGERRQVGLKGIL